jgi:hypothetical protein
VALALRAMWQRRRSQPTCIPDTMKIAVIVVSVAVIVFIAVVLLGQGGPEPSATHADEADPGGGGVSDRWYRGADRPAGPDVEDQSIGGPTVGRQSQTGAGENGPRLPDS